MEDNGPNPYVANIEEMTLRNENFRTTIWTGSHLQATLMTILPGDDIGLETHPNNDQFLNIQQGTAQVVIGQTQTEMESWDADMNSAIFVPAGSWHNVINTSEVPLKLYTIYGPAAHAQGTVHATKADAKADEG